MAKPKDNLTASDSDANPPEIPTPPPTPPLESGKKPTPKYKGATRFFYIGEPFGRLRKNTVLIGTYEQVVEHYKDEISKNAIIAKLIVPVSNFSQIKNKKGDK